MEVGEISDPFESVDQKGQPVYKIVLLKLLVELGAMAKLPI